MLLSPVIASRCSKPGVGDLRAFESQVLKAFQSLQMDKLGVG